MGTVTMVDKALTAANNKRTEWLDRVASAELGVYVRTEYNIMQGPTGTYVTKRKDGVPLAEAQRCYILGLWQGWAELEACVNLNQEEARRGKPGRAGGRASKTRARGAAR